MSRTDNPPWPQIQNAGYDGFVIRFGLHLDDAANRAALAFRDAIETARLPGVEESSTSLVSAYLRYDPLVCAPAAMRAALEALARERDWYSAPLPDKRRLWRIPTVFGGAHGPQLEEAAELAGMDTDAAIASVSQTRVRVQTIGFAPGMPYLGALDAAWDIPRQTELTARVAAGGLCVAIRQLVLFPVATPTGWRHIGQTALELFRADAREPFLLRPGDEVLFEPTDPASLESLKTAPNGGAAYEVIA